MADFTQYGDAQIIVLSAILDFKTRKSVLSSGIDHTWFDVNHDKIAIEAINDPVNWLTKFTQEEVQNSFYIKQTMDSAAKHRHDYKYYLNIVSDCRIATAKCELSKQISSRLENNLDASDLIKMLHDIDSIGGIDLYKSQIMQWCESETGVFTTDKLDRELGYVDIDQKKLRKEAIADLKHESILEDVGDKMGVLRRKATNIVDIDINEQEDPEVKMWLPFGLNHTVKIMPKNIIIVAGETNSGKTAFCMNIAKFNMNKIKTKYISSEMDGPEFRQRIEAFGDTVEQWDVLDKVLCTKNQQDAIIPDGLNIIDYLEVYDNFYRIGEDIKKIWDALTTGVAIINIQKKKGAEFARGGEFTLEKARLAFSLYSHGRLNSKLIGSCLITKAKNGRGSHNPTDKEIFYALDGGVRYDSGAMNEISENSSGWKYYKAEQREKVIDDVEEYVNHNSHESNFIAGNTNFYEGAE